MRSRLIGRDGRIRSLIESFTGTEIAIHGSTVVVIGDELGLMTACTAIEGLLDGAEHSTVIRGMERAVRRRRIEDRSLDSYQIKDTTTNTTPEFEDLVPGLAEIRKKRKNIDTQEPTLDDGATAGDHNVGTYSEE